MKASDVTDPSGAPETKLRVGIVTVSYLPRLGGAVTQTLLLSKYLTSRGHHVEVFCPDLEKDGKFQEEDMLVNRVSHRWMRSFDDNLSRLLIIKRLRDRIQERAADFDVFITPEFNVGPLSLCLARGVKRVGIYGADLTFEFVNIKRRTPIPYDAVLRNRLNEVGLKNWLCIKILNRLQRFMFKRLDCVVALNDEDLNRIRPWARRIEKIGCLVAIPEKSPAKGQSRFDPKVAAIIGRAVCWKKIDESIEIALMLKQRYPELEIHYFGAGPLLKELQGRYAGRVTFHPSAPNAEVLEWLERSDVTINMSEYETFCIANVEAMLRRSLLIVKPLKEYADYLEPGRSCVGASLRDVSDLIPVRLQSIVDHGESTTRAVFEAERTAGTIEKLIRF